MSTRMLIDARHSEETRVAIVKGSQVEDLDYESASRRQLKGNVYLAKVTRVEPSLQAAFVDYGGNRHGFLAFSEIHPDYYQLPAEDRAAILAEEIAGEKAALKSELEDSPKKKSSRSGEKSSDKDDDSSDQPDKKDENDAGDKASENEDDTASTTSDEGDSDSSDADAVDELDPTTAIAEIDDDDDVEDEDDEDLRKAARHRRRLRELKRRYKIQEVIKRRQILLVQVVKEERGNKGAALTTYVSLAGRYCVLMPNSTHSGGISRKISSQTDRRRLKNVISSLDMNRDMGLIIRTAGMKRTKVDIKRDYEYLSRLWNGVRELTMKSVAPSLIYEEGDLIRRTIRDLYNRDIDEIMVEGKAGYEAARDYMNMLMPSHTKKVKHYKDHIPLFHRYQVEGQIEAMYQPVVTLKSGGYLVINPTEALISVDVNSGRSTKEQNIEETAVKTNLEAAEEVARQLRLRDMAGLVVIDFIDMESNANNRAVERRIKESLKADRARIQVGRISSFGLLEMSRQRLRPNLIEASMEPCPHCQGAGVVRSVESAAIMVIRSLEEEGIRGRSALLRVNLHPEVAIYLLNQKRNVLATLEMRHKLVIEVNLDHSKGPSDMEIEREAKLPEGREVPAPVVTMDGFSADLEEEAEESDSSDAEVKIQEPTSKAPASDDEDDKPKRKRRRRRRRRRSGYDDDADEANNQSEDDAKPSDAKSEANDPAGSESADQNQDKKTDDESTQDEDKRPRRPRRRSRRPRKTDVADTDENADGADTAKADGNEPAEAQSDKGEANDSKAEANDDAKPKRAPRRRAPRKQSDSEGSTEKDASENASISKDDSASADAKAAPKRASARSSAKKSAESSSAGEAATEDTKATDQTAEKPKPKPKRAPRAKKPVDAAESEAKEPKVSSEKAAESPESSAKAEVSKPDAAEKPQPAEKPDTTKPEAKKPDEPAKPKKRGWWQRGS